MNDERKDSAEQGRSRTGRRQRSALIYLVILFAAAFLMLLLAYFMQQRSSAEIMGNLSELRKSMGNIDSIDQLVKENQALREEAESLKGDVAELDSARRLQNNEINALLEQAEADKAALEAAQRRVRELEAELAALRGELHLPSDGEG